MTIRALVPAILLVAAPLLPAADQTSPPAEANALLAADRAFSTAAASRSIVDALTAMFRDDVTMVVPGGFASGRAAATAALAANADNLQARASWTPLRAGISADATHGSTFGVMSMRGGDGRVSHAKYMAYWIKTDTAWRVAVYKRAPAPAGDTPAMMPASLPSVLVPVSSDAARTGEYRESLQRAEQAFSDEAQTIGLGPAFAKYGHADAVNMGSPTQAGYTVGAAAIGAALGANNPGPSPVAWSADRAIVASSGDLGITLGYIRANDPATTRAPIPFFTIWRRASTADPWRYIAE
jgi:ketosteroid isomerase-like protein